MSEAGRITRAPWLAASVAAVLMVAAIVAYFTIGTGDSKAAAAHDTAFTSDERAAIAAASTETANLLTFRRAHFQADFDRALQGATGSLKSDITKEKSATLKAMTSGKFDLSADVLHTALVGPADKGNGYVVLVSLNGFKSTQQNQPTAQNLQVTVVKKSGKWLVDDVTNIGVSS